MHLIKRRKIFYILSLLVILASVVSLFVQGLNLGIDFKGGSILQYRLGDQALTEDVNKLVSSKDFVQSVSVQKSEGDFYIRTPELNQEQTEELTALLAEKYPEAQLLGAESVGATVGSELTRNAFLSLGLATLLMLVYISLRFEWTFGISAVIGVSHDVLVVLGLFSIFQWEIDSAFIAAILTVVGYSINDTIVIFDRIRERLRANRREGRAELVDISIMQTLNRSVNTVVTSLFPLVALFFLGGESIKIFVLVMLLGFIVGAYSSICVAGPVWYDINNARSSSSKG